MPGLIGSWTTNLKDTTQGKHGNRPSAIGALPRQSSIRMYQIRRTGPSHACFRPVAQVRGTIGEFRKTFDPLDLHLHPLGHACEQLGQEKDILQADQVAETDINDDETEGRRTKDD
ncbi:hypothetical protein E4U32_005016 [Claviceps aff. humidiphila group G2b]|nr:hypothetical protein E4U32_005016 [Claviceps aff. humidiphila group G2b]